MSGSPRFMKKSLFPLLLFLVPAFLFSQSTRILHYTETTGYNHNTKTQSESMFTHMGNTHGWTITTDDNGDLFSSLDSLEQFAVVVFSNTSGNKGLDATQRANFEAYINNGGSYLGIHAASDTYRHSTANGGAKGTWDWYAENVSGATVQQYPNHTKSSHVDTIYHEIPEISILANLPNPWIKQEEYYYWENGYLAPGFDDILKVGDTGNNSYDDPRTVARCKDLPGGGRTFYTSLGHDKLNFTSNPNFYQLIEDAMLWVLQANQNGSQDGLPQTAGTVNIEGELQQWHKVSLLIGADTLYQESGSINPFLDRKADVTFSHSNGQSLTIPAYFSADGKADSSGATEGNIWTCIFRPPSTGQWSYTVSFRAGTDVAIDTTATPGTAVNAVDGLTGSFLIAASDKSLPDLRNKGRLEVTGGRYRQFQGQTDAYFIKVGPDSPENLLGYADFDNTSDNGGIGGSKNDLQGTGTYTDALGDTYNWPGDGLHRYAPHVHDWNSGDPTWGSGLGKGIIGAINYLASEEMNSLSMILCNTGGDGQDVHPFLTYNNSSGPQDDRLRYDISKLAQWDIVMDYAEQKGFHLHFKLMETENLELMQDKELWLYYREMMARFGHHLAVTWNLGEENDLPIGDIQDRAIMLRKMNGYPGIHVVVHTYPYEVDLVYPQLLGLPEITGISLQDGYQDAVDVLMNYDTLSFQAGNQWVVCYDEVNSAWHGVTPDAGYPGTWTSNPPSQTVLKEKALAGPLMTGAEGIESYFGYDLPMSDLDAEDFRSRDQWWDYCRWAKTAIEMVPFWEMERAQQYTSDPSDEWVLSNGTDSWLYYSQDGQTIDYQLPSGQYNVLTIDMVDGTQSSTNSFVSGTGYSISNASGNEFFAVVSTIVPFDVNQLEVTERNGEVCWRAPDKTQEIMIQSQEEGRWSTVHQSYETEGCWVNSGCEARTIRVVAKEINGEETISKALAVSGRPVASFTEDNMYIDCVLGKEYQVIDLLGRVIRSGEMSPEGIRLSGLMTGYYMVRVESHLYKISRD